mmetsp:Transcript_44275/g.93024  ORF Transcript_44275/g.93024 Transcript_44275/m.93024 type:complete len:340 (-) Transcript_44275:1280-2299(-)
MTERLHYQAGGEFHTGQGSELVARHRAGGVLTPHGGREGFAVLTRTDSGRVVAGFADDLLRERESPWRTSGYRIVVDRGWILEGGEDAARVGIATQCRARLGSETAADDQGYAPSGADLVQQYVGLELERRHHPAGLAIDNPALSRINVDDIPHFQPTNVHFDGQRARIFHGVEKYGSDLPSDANPAALGVGNVRYLSARVPNDRIGRRFPRGPRAHDVADVGQRMALLEQFFHLTERSHATVVLGNDARTRVLEHGQRVQRNVGAAPRILGGGEVVGVGLARYLEHRDGHLVRHSGFGREPFGIGPGFEDRGGRLPRFVGNSRGLREVRHVVEGAKYQ